MGKYGGSWLGAVMSGATPIVRNYLGLALLPQAGVAIGLVFMISSDPQLSSWSTVITPVVLAGVVLSELVGPLFARLTIEKSGEAATQSSARPECGDRSPLACDLWLRSADGISLAPWTGEALHPAAEPRGVVVFGAYHFATARALARIAVILANHYHSLPMSVRVFDKSRGPLSEKELKSLFLAETDEAEHMGYPMRTEVIYDDPASGLVASAEYNGARAVVLGYPVGRKPLSFQKVLDQVAANVLCPVVAVRFVGTLAWDRILVPFIFPGELDELRPILEAMAGAGHPQMTFQQLLHSDSSPEEIASADRALHEWLAGELYDIETRAVAEAVDSRLEAILDRGRYHDLIIMTAARRSGLQRMFFGSLANSVVHNCRKPVFVVYTPQLQPHEAATLDAV
jgi:nucleotide-binding universal stress UspA family protein